MDMEVYTLKKDFINSVQKIMLIKINSNFLGFGYVGNRKYNGELYNYWYRDNLDLGAFDKLKLDSVSIKGISYTESTISEFLKYIKYLVTLRRFEIPQKFIDDLYRISYKYIKTSNIEDPLTNNKCLIFHGNNNGKELLTVVFSNGSIIQEYFNKELINLFDFKSQTLKLK